MQHAAGGLTSGQGPKHWSSVEMLSAAEPTWKDVPVRIFPAI